MTCSTTLSTKTLKISGSNNLFHMINIFNLFLTLFSFWLLFAYSGDHFSQLYVLFGLVSSIVVSLIAWKIKIINKYSHFTFLHFGFYKHFISLILSSFYQSLLIAYRVAIASPRIDPKIHFLPIGKLNNSELVLLISTLNLIPGVLFVSLEDKKIIISTVSEFYFEQLDLDKIISSLDKINDSRLV